MLQTMRIRLIGLTPLLMNRYTGDETEVKNFNSLTDDEATAFAKEHAYLRPDGKPFIPGDNLQQALISGGKYGKGKGRGNLSQLVAAGVQINEHEILLDCEPPTLFRKMRKNPVTKGRMLGYRLRIDLPWTADTTLSWDDVLFQRQQIQDVVVAAGIRVGLMDWRPEKRGPYGQFKVEFPTSLASPKGGKSDGKR